MVDASLVFSSIGSTLSLGLFAAQLPLMRRVIRERDSSPYSAVPSLSTLGTCVLWLGYACSFQGARPDIVAINGVGIFPFSLGNLAVLAWYHPRRQARVRIMGAAACIVGFAAALYGATVASGALDPPTARLVCGLCAVTVNIGIFASPIQSVVAAYRELDAARVPVLFTLIGLACALCWGAFGLVLGDPFLMAPNFIGAVLSASQLGVLAAIRRKRAAAGPRFPLGDGDHDASAAGVPGGSGAAATAVAAGGAAAGGAAAPLPPPPRGAPEETVEIIPTVPAIAIVRSTSMRERRRYAYSWEPPGDDAELARPRVGGGAGAAAPAATGAKAGPPLVPGAARAGIPQVSSSTALMSGAAHAGITPSSSHADLAAAGEEGGDDSEPPAVTMDEVTRTEADSIARAVSRHASFRLGGVAAPGGGGGVDGALAGIRAPAVGSASGGQPTPAPGGAAALPPPLGALHAGGATPGGLRGGATPKVD